MINNFGVILQNEIRRNATTQQELAEATGINAGLISKYCKGTITPSLYNFYLLSEALAFSPDVVLTILYGGL